MNKPIYRFYPFHTFQDSIHLALHRFSPKFHENSINDYILIQMKSEINNYYEADLQIQKTYLYNSHLVSYNYSQKMTSKQAKYKAESIKLSAMLEKTLQEIQIYSLREKQHLKQKEILNQQIHIQNQQILYLNTRIQSFNSYSPSHLNHTKLKQQQRQNQLKKIQKLHSYHTKTQQLLAELQKVLIKNANLSSLQDISEIPLAKIHKKLFKYHNNYVSIQEELLKYTESQQSLKNQLSKMFDQNRLLVQELSKIKNKDNRSKSKSIDKISEHTLLTENNILKERINSLQREIQRLCKQTKSSRLSPFEQRLRQKNNKDGNINKRLMGSRFSSKSKERSHLKSAFEDQDGILANPLDDISQINRPDMEQLAKQLREKEEMINKLKQKIEKLQIENRTIKNIHQQTMRKIQLQTLNKNDQYQDQQDQQGEQPHEQEHTHPNSRRDSTHCPHRNSLTQNPRSNSLSQDKKKKFQLSQVQKQKKVWAKKYEQLFDQIRLLNKQILLHELNQKQTQQQLFQTTQKLQHQLEKLKLLSQEKLQLNNQIQLLTNTLHNNETIIQQLKQTINRKTLETQQLHQQLTLQENHSIQAKSNSREELSSLKNQLHQQNNRIHQLQHQAQSHQHHLTQIQNEKLHILQENQNLNTKINQLINQLSESHKSILEHQNTIFQLTLTLNQLKNTQQQLNKQLTDSKDKNSIFIKGLQKQKIQLQEYITQIKQESDKLVVRHHQAQLTINNLQESINTVKKELNQLAGTWGVDNIHLLLTNFKAHYKQTVANLKAFKQLNQDLTQKSSQLQRLLQKSYNKDNSQQDRLKDQVQRQKNNQKLNLDMWKLKFSEHIPELMNKSKRIIASYDSLLSVIEQHLVQLPNQYIDNQLSNQLQYVQPRQKSPQISPKTSRAKDSDTLSQKSESKKFTSKKQKQQLFTYSSKQYKQLETQLYQLKLTNKNLQDQLQIKTNQIQNLNLQIFKHQTKSEELQEDYQKILQYGKQKENEALLANSHIQQQISQGILSKQHQFNQRLHQQQQTYQQQIINLTNEFQSKVHHLTRNHQNQIQTVKNQHSYQILGLNHQKQTLNQQIQQLQLKNVQIQTLHDQTVTQINIERQQEQENSKNKIQQMKRDWQDKFQKQKQHFQSDITKIKAQNQQKIGQLLQLNENTKSQAAKILQLNVKQRDEQIRVMSESIRIKQEQIQVKMSQIQLKNQLLQQKQFQINKNNDSIRLMQFELNQKQETICLLQLKLKAQDGQNLNSLSMKNQQVQDILSQLKHLKTQYQHQMQTLQSQNQLQLQSLHNKITALQKSNHRLEQENRTLKQIDNSLEQNNLNEQQANHSLEQTNQNITIQNADISLSKTHIQNQQHSQLQSFQQNISQLELIIQQKDQQNLILQKNILLQNQQLQQLSNIVSKTKNQLNQILELNTQLQKTEKQLQNQHSQMELKLWELTMYKQKFLLTKAENDNLESQVQNLQSQIHSLSEQLSSVHKQNSLLQVQLSAAQKQLQSVKKSPLITSKVSQKSEELAQNHVQDNDHEWLMGKKANQTNKMSQQTQNQLDQLTKTTHSLRMQLESLKHLNNNLSTQNQQLKQQADKNQIYINSLRGQIQSLKQANQNLQEDYQILSEQLDKTKIENRKLKNEIKKERQTQKSSRIKERQTLQSILTERQEQKLTLSSHAQKLSDSLLLIDQLSKQNQQLKSIISKLKDSLTISHSSYSQTLKNQLSQKSAEIQNLRAEIYQQKTLAISCFNTEPKPVNRQDNFNITESYRTIVLNDPPSISASSTNNPQTNQNRLSSTGLLNKKANLLTTQTQDKQSKTIKRLKDQNLSYLQEIQYLKKYNNDLKLKNQQLYEKILNKNNQDSSDKSHSRNYLSSDNNDTSIDDLSNHKLSTNKLSSPRNINLDELNIFNSEPDKLQMDSYRQLKKQSNLKEDNWMMLKKNSTQEKDSFRNTLQKLTEDNNKMKKLILHYEEENQLTQQKYQLTLKRQAEIEERYNQIEAINKIVTEKLQEMKSMYTMAKTHAETLEVQKSQLISENLKLSSQISSLKTIYEEDEQGLAEKNQRIISLEEKLEKLERELTVMKEEKNILRKEKSDLLKSLESKEAPKQQHEITELHQKISKLQIQLKESNQIRQMYYNQLKSSETQKGTQRNSTLPLLNKIQEMSQTITSLQQKLYEKQQFLNQNKQEISQLKRFIDENRSQVESIIEQNINTKAKIRQVQLILTQRQTKDLQTYKETINQQQTQIQTLNHKIQLLQRQGHKSSDASSLKQSDSNLKKQFGQKCKLCNRVFNNEIAITIHPVKTRKNSSEFEKELLWQIQTLKLKVEKLQTENTDLKQKLINEQRSVVKLSVEQSVHSNMYDTPVVVVEEERLVVNSEESKDQKASGKSNSSGKSAELRQLKLSTTSELLIYSNNNKLIDENKCDEKQEKQKPLRIIQSQSKNQDDLEPNPTILHPKTSVIDTLTHKLINSQRIISLFKTENLQLNHQLELQKHKIELLEKQLRSKIEEIIKMKRAIEQISQQIQFEKKRNKNFQQLYDKYRASVKKQQNTPNSSKTQNNLTKSVTLQGTKKKQENLQKSQPSAAKNIDKNLIESKTKLTVISEESVGSSIIKQPKQISSPKKIITKMQLPLQRNPKTALKHKINSPNEKGKADSVFQRQSSDEKFREKKSPRNK